MINLFSRKSRAIAPPTPAPPPLHTKPPAAHAKVHADTRLKVDLPDVFAYQNDETKAQLTRTGMTFGLDKDSQDHTKVKGSILLVEGDDEVARLISRLLQNDGYFVATASCLAEARERMHDVTMDYLLARRESVPVNLQSERLLRDMQVRTTVRIVDTFSALMLGQVIDYESMTECHLPLLDLMISLLEGTHGGANGGARGHAHNVAKYCRLVGLRMGMPRRDLDALTVVAYLHDLGPMIATNQIGQMVLAQNGLVPPSLRPTVEMLANISFPYNFNELINAAYERTAGPAYERPRDDDDSDTAQQPLGARILRVADTYDTMRRAAPDKQDEDALFDWMRSVPQGTFDTDVMETFIHLRKHERAVSAMNIFWAAVLIVDPHHEELNLLKLRLENDDCHVHLARTVEEAMRALHSENITLVVSERTLGNNGDGFQLLRAIKNDPELRSVSFAFHAPANVDLVKQALEQGAEDWFTKPHNVEIMAMKLGRIISRRHADPASSDGVHGNVRDMGIMELVQILSMANRSVEISLEHGATTGLLALHLGKIVHAKLGRQTGDAAAIEFLLSEDGRFRILPLRKAPPANVTMSTDNLILQCCYEKDTRAAGGATAR